MGTKERLMLIQGIEKEYNAKLISYFTGDRQVISARIADDAVLPLYRQLLSLDNESERVILFLYSQGGDVSTPWRIVSTIREFCKEFYVMIPYKAYSAATLLSLGADKIVMGRKSELGPIDPTLSRSQGGELRSPPQEINIEDVSSYISFIKERANITDQDSVTKLVCQLAEHLTPLALGMVNRQHSHIRLVASKMIKSRKESVGESNITSIIEALTKEMYSHGHGIGRLEAKEIGLPVEPISDDVEELIWALYEEYEEYLALNDAIDPEEIFRGSDDDEKTLSDIPIAVIESLDRFDVFKTDMKVRRKRNIPSNPQINLNFSLGLPAGLDPQQIPGEAQRIIQELLNDLPNQAMPQIQREIARQSPEIGVEWKAYAGSWVCEREENIGQGDKSETEDDKKEEE